MYKRLRIYYLYTVLPFAFLLIAAFIYRSAVMKTISSNPHPQINYLIFIITLVGGVLILMSISKLVHEGKQLSDFSDAVRSGADPATLQTKALNYDADIAYVLRMIAASSGRAITHQEQIALESEIEKASKRLSSRNALPSFLSGLLVGLGLLGTFIGLLATLNDIATLISSFGSLDMKTADPIEVFGQMVKRMEAPMHSMGIAFSASMYGLLGSIILGFMMVSVRRCMGEILSILGSEVAQHIEFALSRDGFAYSKTGIDKLGAGSAEQLTMKKVVSGQKTVAGVVVDGEGLVAQSIVRKQVAEKEAIKNDTSALLESIEEGDDEEFVRVLRRIEVRLAESSRLQERSLSAEVDDFQKQRADMLRTLAEQAEAMNNFRMELQRVGRQLGSVLGLMEKSNDEIVNLMREMIVRMADDTSETHRLLRHQQEDRQR
ncbi:MAG TPA: hypothetical protein PLG02_07530 [Methylotenera sp.]|nr:hypothetical protein [Methylotenera sp.]